MDNVCLFVKKHTALCVCTLGLAVVGYLAYRAIKRVWNKNEVEQKTDHIAKNAFNEQQKNEFGNNPLIKESPKLPHNVQKMQKSEQKVDPLIDNKGDGFKEEHKPKIEGNIKEQEEKNLKNEKKEQIQGDEEKKVKPAILYMSITGNPTHLGHMAAVATAIDALRKQHIPVEEARVSLSFESYHKSKAQKAGKCALSQEAREYLLKGAIQEAEKRNMFQDIKVSYWNDQDQGESDHPDSYKRLASLKKTHQVYLVAGIDLCRSMRNWPDVENAIVIQREMEGYEKALDINPPDIQQNRIYAEPLYPEYKKFSSSAVHKRTILLEPPELQDYFNKQVGFEC